MAAIDKSLSNASALQERGESLLTEIALAWHQFILTAFDPYRPEKHYMRGPGPACRRKQSE